jgi:CRISPR-associated protein Cas1
VISGIEPNDPIPISLVAHHVFCPRRAWLEAIGETVDSHQLAVGIANHHASDDPRASRIRRLRAVDVASVDLGVVGRCDSVELDEAGLATVVEYKSTPVRRRAEITAPIVVQLPLQAHALAESGFTVAGAAVYFTHHQTRVPVNLGPNELDLARQHVSATAALLTGSTAPAALQDDSRCRRCSHIGVCLPDQRALGPIKRQIKVADPDSQVLHLTTPGARACIRAGRVHIDRREEELASIPIERVLALVVHGNIDLSSALTRELLWRKAPIVWCSSAGRVIGWASSADTPNRGPRVRQNAASNNRNLSLARQFVTTKIANQATLLRRHGDAVDTASQLRALQRRAVQATSLTSLFGVEGAAAARYFAQFHTMLSAKVRTDQGLTFSARTRRPAHDPHQRRPQLLLRPAGRRPDPRHRRSSRSFQ